MPANMQNSDNRVKTISAPQKRDPPTLHYKSR